MNDTKESAQEQKLIPAHDNIWYWLATLHGEQDGNINHVLAARNRAAWIRWFAPREGSELYTALISQGFSRFELAGYTGEQQRQLLQDCAERLGRRVPSEVPSSADVCNFSNTRFDRSVSFRGFPFDRHIVFSGAKFSGKCDFSGAKFDDTVDFREVQFDEVADFKSATFSMGADFGATTFLRSAIFDKATFAEAAHFKGANFSMRARFQRADFVGEVNFEEAIFSNRVDFINAEFCSRTVFAGATYATSVPDFRGAKLHDATEWRGIIWPKPGASEAPQDNVYAYERIRQEMERVKKPEEEQFFARKEFRAKRELVKWWSAEWLLNYSYGMLSDYGHSVARPLVGLLVLFLIGMLIFCLSPALPGKSITVFHAAAISFSNILAIFPGVGKVMLGDGPSTLPGLFRLFAVAQFVFGALLLFLLGLALRNRFRLK